MAAHDQPGRESGLAIDVPVADRRPTALKNHDPFRQCIHPILLVLGQPDQSSDFIQTVVDGRAPLREPVQHMELFEEELPDGLVLAYPGGRRGDLRG